MYLGKIFKFLKENEIVGCESWNTLVTWLRGLRSGSEFIELNPNSSGGMTIDLDVESLKNCIDGDTTIVEINHSFKATVNNSTIRHVWHLQIWQEGGFRKLKLMDGQQLQNGVCAPDQKLRWEHLRLVAIRLSAKPSD